MPPHRDRLAIGGDLAVHGSDFSLTVLAVLGFLTATLPSLC